jgi:maltose O-acetyltransferase
LANRIIKKIENQVAKLNRLLYRKEIKRFSKKFKSCGTGLYVKFPICLEGQEHISVGSDASINAFVHMWGHGGITIGNDCLIASHVSINSVTHDTKGLYRDSVVERPVVIGNNVWIGAHAVILPGVTIGNNAIVGAGAVVTQDVAENAVVTGVPAKIIRYVEERDAL